MFSLNRRMKPLLGTFVEITWEGPPNLHAVVERAFQRIEEVSTELSFQSQTSDLSRLNKAPIHRELPVSRDLEIVVREAQRIATDTKGLFDPVCIKTCPEGSVNHILWLESGRCMKTAPVILNLSGIAKGFAVDEAIRILEEEGITAALVNAGGDLRCFGHRLWPLSIRCTETGQTFDVGPLRNQAVATSTGSLFHHPLQRSAVIKNSGISVLAETCMKADAYTKPIALYDGVTSEWCQDRGLRALLWSNELTA